MEVEEWQRKRRLVLSREQKNLSLIHIYLCRDPWHPYTKALLDSVMPPDPLKARKQKVPAVHEGKSEGGCPYFGSCGYKMEMCKDAAPEMYDFEGRAVSCHLYSKQQRAGRNPNYKMTSQI